MPRVLIPPRRGAELTADPSPAMKQRNRNIRSVERQGRRTPRRGTVDAPWRRTPYGDTNASLVET